MDDEEKSMSTVTVEPLPQPEQPPSPEAAPNYLNVHYGVRSWLLTTDHKRIAILYLISITLMFFIGGFAAVLIRLELLTPKGDLMEAETYNKMFTMHVVVMIHTMRAPGLTWFRLPLFLWSMYATSIIILLGTPVIAITLVLVAVER